MAEESMSSPRGHLAVSASPLPEQASPKSTPTPQQFRTPPSSEQAARELDFLERRRATQQIPTHAPTSQPADNQESDVHADVSRGRAQVPVAERLAKNLGDRIGDAAQSFKKWLKATPKPSAKSPIATRRRKTPPEDETPSSRILLLDTPDNYTSVKPAVRQKPDNPGGGEATDEESSSARDTTNMLTWVEQRPRALFTNSPTGNDSPSKEKSDDVLFPVARKRRRRGNDSPSEEKSDDVLFPVARKRRRRGANPPLEEPALFPGGDEGSAHSQEAQRRAPPPPPPPPPPRRAPPPPRQSPPPQPPPRRRRGSRQSFSMSDDGLSGDDGRGGNGGGGLHNGDVMSAMKRRVRKRDPASRIYLSVDYIPRAVWRRITRKAGIERIRKEAFNDLYGLADAFLENVLVNVNMLMWAKKKNVVTSKDISYVLNDIHNFKTSDFP